MEGFDAWITGRKGFQNAARASLPLFEAEGERIKINPLVGWSASDVLKYIEEAGLPRHPLVAKGFPSIGCLPCTSPVGPGEDERAGRWRGRGKVECGIHVGALDAGSGI
jgi:phosphoadenosine phosphosulfate reductase